MMETLKGLQTPRRKSPCLRPWQKDLPAWAASSAAGVSRRLSLSTLPCPRLSFSLECISLWEATAAAPDWVEGQGSLVFVAASVSPSENCARKASGHQGSPQPLACPRSLSSASAGSALGAAAEGTPDRPQRAARVGVRAAAARAPLFPRPCRSACSLGFALGPGRRDSSSCGWRLLVWRRAKGRAIPRLRATSRHGRAAASGWWFPEPLGPQGPFRSSAAEPCWAPKGLLHAQPTEAGGHE